MRILEKKAILLSIVFTIIILSTGCEIFSGKTEVEPVESVKQKVVAYLFTKGYKEKEYKIDVEYNKIAEGKFGGPYAINVIFNDETNVIYNYKYNYKSKSKDITQIGVAPINGKEDKDFKHYEQ